MRKIILFILFINIVHSNESNIKTFGTLGAVYNDNKNYTFRKNVLQKNGSSKDIDFNTDTLLGIQLSQKLNDKNSIILQVIAQKNHNDKTAIHIDWGYLKYFTNDNYTFKIGRIRTPYYKNSDNLNIGYSNLLIREPIEVYGQVPFSAYNGIEFYYSGLINDYFYNLQINYGKEKLIVPIHTLNEEIDIKLNNLYALNFTIGNSYINFRATYLNSDISALNPMLEKLFIGLKQFGLNELADQYELKNKNSKYFGLGIFYEYDNFIFNSEYGQRNVPSFYGDMSGYYLTLGYNMDNLTPYLSYSKSKMEQNININSISKDLNYLLAIQNTAQNTLTLGFKYYINENIDLKMQYEHIKPKGLHGGFYTGDSTIPTNLNVISIACDFVF